MNVLVRRSTVIKTILHCSEPPLGKGKCVAVRIGTSQGLLFDSESSYEHVVASKT